VGELPALGCHGFYHGQGLVVATDEENNPAPVHNVRHEVQRMSQVFHCLIQVYNVDSLRKIKIEHKSLKLNTVKPYLP
jgi:hypothetical protein